MTTLATQSPVADTLTGQNRSSHRLRKDPLAPKTGPFGIEEGSFGTEKGSFRAENGTCITPSPIAGPLLTLRLGLTPATLVLIAAPATVVIVMVAAWVTLRSVGFPLYMNEMCAAAIVSAVGGMFASIPLFVSMGEGAQMIAKAGILSIAVRCSMVLFGMILAMQPAWGLVKMPFVYWVLAYYFPMLIVETALVAWLSVKAKF